MRITGPHRNKCPASSLGCQHDTARICCGAIAAERRCCRSIYFPARRSAAKPPHTAAAVDRWDRRTQRDGRSALHCPGSVNKPVFSFLRQLTTWHCPHLLLNAVLLRRRPCSNRSISLAGWTHSSKRAAAATESLDRQKHGPTFI